MYHVHSRNNHADDIPMEIDNENNDSGGGIREGDAEADALTHSHQPLFSRVVKPVPLDPSFDAVRAKSVLKLKIMSPTARLATASFTNDKGAGGGVNVVKSKQPETELVLSRCTATQEVLHVNATAELNSALMSLLLPTAATAATSASSATNQGFAVAALLEEVWRQLWLGSTRADVLLWLPTTVKIAGEQYNEGSVMSV